MWGAQISCSLAPPVPLKSRRTAPTLPDMTLISARQKFGRFIGISAVPGQSKFKGVWMELDFRSGFSATEAYLISWN